MISKRNYLAILIVMVVLFFLFQFSQIYKNNYTDFKLNMYEKEAEVSQPATLQEETLIVYIGDSSEALYGTVSEWCGYAKLPLQVISAQEVLEGTFVDFSNSSSEIRPKMAILSAENLDDWSDEFIDRLQSYADAGISLVISGVSGEKTIPENKALLRLLGISSIRTDKIAVEGIELYQGLLLGGGKVYQPSDAEETVFQDLELQFPWYVLGGGTEKYMVGLLDREEISPTLFPAVIWKNSSFSGNVFVVMGDYLDNQTGIGFLSAFLYESSDYLLYPVVNAQTVSIQDFSGLSEEKDRVMQEIYSRSAKATMKDIIWPGLITVGQRNDLIFTCFMQTQYDYQNGITADGTNLEFYLKQFREMWAETGRSLSHTDSVSLEAKLNYDDGFYTDASPYYSYQAYCLPDANPEVVNTVCALLGERGGQTLLVGESSNLNLVSYSGDLVTVQKAYIDAREYSYKRDLLQTSLLSGLGYSSLLIDLTNVVWPADAEDTEYHWEKVLKDVSGNMKQHYAENDVYEYLSISQADERIRCFLNEAWDSSLEGNTLRLTCDNNSEGGFFILRLHGQKIKSIVGALSKEIETDCYLIQMKDKEASIVLATGSSVYSFWN